MTMQRAYSLLEIKSIDDDLREITGMATTPTTDRLGDIVEPKGAEFELPLPLLWQHDSKQPIGHVTHAKVTSKGIEIKAKILRIDEPGKLKDRLDEAWQSVKSKLVRGLSIGFQPTETAAIDGTFGFRFIKWLWLELSAVTIPANAETSILTVKSIDTAERAASGQSRSGVVRLDTKTAGASAIKSIKAPEGNSMKVSEQITSFEAKRAATVARMEALMTKAGDEGRSLEKEEAEEYDTLQTELKTTDEHLVRLREFESSQATRAVAVKAVDSVDSGSAARAQAATIRVTENLPPGIEFAQYVKCLAIAQGNVMHALEIAKSRYPDRPRIIGVLKAAVAAGTTGDATWAGPLLEQYTTLAGEFVTYLRPATIIGKFGQGGIPALTSVPFNVRLVGQTSGGSAYWVGQGAPKPLTKVDFDARTLGWAKVANIAVLSQELIRFSSPSADALVRDALRDAIVERLDIDFIDPAKGAVSNVSPASITNGVTPISSSGTTADATRADVQALFGAYLAANQTPQGAVWIMSATTALALSMMTNPLGNKEFPGISMNGGTFEGLPVIVSQYVAHGSTNGAQVILVNASDILLADDGQVVIDASREASLEMLNNPTNNSATPTATSLVSMFQTNSIAIRAERFINWSKKRAEAVQYMTGVFWNGSST